jgi:transcriptional regulator with XRE-family HTH domain
MSTNALGQRIKAAREKAGLSQTAVAEYMGVTRAAISQYETNPQEVNIPSTNLIKLSKILDVSVDYLLGTEYAEFHHDIEFQAKEPETIYETKNIKKLEHEIELLQCIKEKLIRHNADQALLIEVLKEKLELPKKLPENYEKEVIGKTKKH